MLRKMGRAYKFIWSVQDKSWSKMGPGGKMGLFTFPKIDICS